jgi:phosphoadenosine phosphosulfate reductase
VLFLQTGKHFPETLRYRSELAARLGLTDVRDLCPVDADMNDASDELWFYDPDACCALRKVRPLERALGGFDAVVTGRKRHQAATRRKLEFVERDGERVRINPLADWTREQVAAEFHRRGLPPHPLVAEGFASIGCGPCTRPVGAHEDIRAGRWAHAPKVECGIHRPARAALSDGPARAAVSDRPVRAAAAV